MFKYGFRIIYKILKTNLNTLEELKIKICREIKQFRRRSLRVKKSLFRRSGRQGTQHLLQHRKNFVRIHVVYYHYHTLRSCLYSK